MKLVKVHSLTLFLFMGFLLPALSSCQPAAKNPQTVDRLPDIYPDYIGVTIPRDIAPLNFSMAADSCDAVDVVIRGSKGGEIRAQGSYADFDINLWHELTRQNSGGEITVSVSARSGGQWTRYKDFPIYVSEEALDDYGLTYRRLPPGYEVGGNLGIYQRDIHSFREDPIITVASVPGKCVNCHTANATNPQMFTFQARGENGATLLYKDGKQHWMDTSTPETKGSGSYAYWHPSGDYVAYSVSAVYQSFFTGTYKPIEVYHTFSNIVVLDTRSHELVLSPVLQSTGSLEIFPAFSPDGKQLFFSTSAACWVPDEYEKVKCSIVSVPFDASTGRVSGDVDTLLNGPLADKSYVLARPSYDGKWLLFVRCGRSNFPIAQRDADLWIMDLNTRQTWSLDNANSPDTESSPNWSSNSRWIVFASKRDDGIYTRLYITAIDRQGRAAKPFLLPQRNPKKYYGELFDAYNVPDFTSAPVDFDIRQAQRSLLSTRREKVSIRR